MDTNNPIVKLCVEGMQAEAEGRLADAARLFREAWEARQDDFDACIAAHYVARHQESPEDILRWNQEALDRADAVNDERVRPFYPSLYLNMGRAKELMGEREEAKRYYALAAAITDELPGGRYRDVVAGAVARGLNREDASPC